MDYFDQGLGGDLEMVFLGCIFSVSGSIIQSHVFSFRIAVILTPLISDFRIS